MSGFYILFDEGTLAGIDGHLVRQENKDIPNGLPEMAGELARSRTPFDIDGKKWLYGQLVDMSEAEKAIVSEDAYQKRVATITPDLWQTATLFRNTLRKHFGDGAETNHEVTAQTVKEYFIAKQQAGTITASETADSVFLAQTFDVIKAWTGDGTSWSFPWELIP